MKHRLFQSDALARGQMRRIEVEGIAIVVVRTPAGEVRALRDVCPHRQARLSRGLLQEMVSSEAVGTRTLVESVVLRCPWHGYEFDVETGRCPADPDHVRVKTYAVTVEDGFITIER